MGAIYNSPSIRNSVYLGQVTGDTYSFTGATDKSKFTKCYELSSSGGITAVNGSNIQSIELDGLTQEFYTGLGFDETVWDFSTISSGYPVLQEEKTVVETPVISPNGATFTDPVKVSITSSTKGATIYYTTDGTLPLTTSNVYTAEFELTGNAVVRAIAVKMGMTSSQVAEARFTKTEKAVVETPVISPNGGNFNEPVRVSITSATKDATIYYTTDGKIPTKDSSVYTTEFELTQSAVVKAIAVKTDMTDSVVAEATFTKVDKPSAPDIPSSPVYQGNLYVTGHAAQAKQFRYSQHIEQAV